MAAAMGGGEGGGDGGGGGNHPDGGDVGMTYGSRGTRYTQAISKPFGSERVAASVSV